MLQSGGSFPCVIDFSPFSFYLYVSIRREEQRPAPGWDNLHVGAVSRHRLDSLNASNDLFK